MQFIPLPSSSVLTTVSIFSAPDFSSFGDVLGAGPAGTEADFVNVMVSSGAILAGIPGSVGRAAVAVVCGSGDGLGAIGDGDGDGVLSRLTFFGW